MKKNICRVISVLMIGSICIFSTACTSTVSKAAGTKIQAEKNQEIKIKTKTLKLDEKYLIGDVEIPVFSNFMNKEVEERINNYFEKNATDFIDMQMESAKLMKKEDGFKKNKIASNFKVTYKDKNLVSVIINKNVDNSFRIKDCYTLDLNTGKQIFLYRLFDPMKDYKQIIKNYVEEDMKKKGKEYFLSKSDIKDNQYYLKENSLVIYLNQYETNFENEDYDEFEIPFEAFQDGINTKISLKPYSVKVDAKKINKDNQYLIENINIPVISGLEDEKVQNRINKMFESDAKKFRNELNEYAKSAFEDFKKDGYEMRPYIADITFEEKKNEKDILSIYTVYYQYTGGAHGMHNDIAYNIDLKTGNIIKLKDLFKEGYNYKKVIDEKIKEQIDKIQSEYKEKKLKEGEKIKNIYLPYNRFEGIDKNQRFYLKDNRLCIYFGLYEIASYAEGIPTFEIPLSELKEGLKEDFSDLL
ncbi:DUF4163 domain-containing protein [Crassaminicella thermophila]|uniref:DUF4163 domain-containing protein n=1 Tax=Crassaminicella thermophila TaxID=2599308 RepID=A0A5C0SEA4_CRATE|nr:DUF4163 domain-containing protein [Crassaminicella thermophila]QEK11624.1 DUF4163 domain-containing protein [Crassaminicella thermophila]